MYLLCVLFECLVCLGFYRVVAHVDNDASSLHDATVHEERRFEQDIVETYALNVFVGARIVVGDNLELLAVRQVDGHLVEDGASHRVDG